jgi:hypothetical protein
VRSRFDEMHPRRMLSGYQIVIVTVRHRGVAEGAGMLPRARFEMENTYFAETTFKRSAVTVVWTAVRGPSGAS